MPQDCPTNPLPVGKFDTFIFDLDGTLLDTVPDLALLTNHVLREVGCPERTQEEILSFVGAGVRRLIYLALPENTPEDVQERAMEIWNQHFHEYYHNTHPYPGVIKLLDGLRERGCGIGVVSNKLQAGVDQILSICLPGKVDVMYGESPMIPRKPDPTGLKQAMNMLKTAPADTVYVGDSPGDIKAANNAGVFAVAALWGYHKKEDFAAEDACPDAFATSPSELLQMAR
ncbi:MAG: HAD family hydrolase [Eggerthellaceae bacterium]|nr:HAD family hydrolase [Eggerthellaceae bacterium]